MPEADSRDLATSQQFNEAVGQAVENEIPDADLTALRASLDLVRLSTRWIQHLEHNVHRPAGWSFSGFRIMFCVWAMGELEPREIAHLSGLTRATISSALNTLERDGLVTRTRDHADGRLVTVRMTDDGRRRLKAAYEVQNALETEFFGGLDDGGAGTRPSTSHLLGRALPSTMAEPNTNTEPL